MAGLAQAFGSGAMTNSISDFVKADLLFVIGSNTTECHPIIGRFIRQSVKFKGTKLIVADPRNIELARVANIHLGHKPGTDVALINAMMNVIINENLHDQEFIDKRTEGYDELVETVSNYDTKRATEITGVPQDEIIAAARLFAEAESAIVTYSMGITQHTTGTDNVKSLANIVMLTGNIGRQGTGLSPLRGQNNVQGACDMGALPNVYPGYQSVDNPEIQEKFESAWGCKLNDKPGLTTTLMTDAMYEGRIKTMYVVGENPLMSEPHLNHAREAMERLEFLVVQDIFPTETALMADAILPAAVFAEKNGTYTNTERRIQKLRKAIDPPGEAKPDWVIVSMLAERMGHSFGFKSTAEIMDEIVSLTPSYGGIDYHRLDTGGLQWPCPNRDHPGTPLLHKDLFTRGKGKFHAVEYKPPAESTSEEYPLILTTGRILEHWHTGSMSRRSDVLDTLQPNGMIDIHPDDALKLGITDGDKVAVSSARGRIETRAHITDKAAPGVVYMAFHWSEAPANILTNPALDPSAKIPEFKVSAVKAVLSVLDRGGQNNE